MNYSRIFFLLLIYFICSSIAQENENENDDTENGQIVLSAMGYSIDNAGDAFNLYVERFNEYSKANNLNISLNVNFISNTNSSLSFNNMALMVENLIKRKDNKYDIVFYDNGLSSIYGPYLLNLDKYLPKEHIDMYNKDILQLTSYYNDNLVGLVRLKIFLLIFFFNYYNK